MGWRLKNSAIPRATGSGHLQEVTGAVHGQFFDVWEPRAQQRRALDEQPPRVGAQDGQDRL